MSVIPLLEAYRALATTPHSIAFSPTCLAASAAGMVCSGKMSRVPHKKKKANLAASLTHLLLACWKAIEPVARCYHATIAAHRGQPRIGQVLSVRSSELSVRIVFTGKQREPQPPSVRDLHPVQQFEQTAGTLDKWNQACISSCGGDVMKIRNNMKGFTLIELLVVIAIIAILIGLARP
jgi:prepilin-type N-terminal cleavage/methylation domain-containing protein